MKATNQATLEKVFNWINTTIEAVPYGELSVKLVIHDGQIQRVDETRTKKHRLIPGGEG